MMEEVSKKRKFGELEIENPNDKGTEEKKESSQEGGFAAYSKINPFALGVQSAFGAAAGSGFGSSSSGATASNPFAALGKAVAASSSSSSSFGVGKQSWLEGKNLTLTLPSPKSPKHNPFSTPSPVHNPFVTVVNQHQDELWKAMAQKQLENNGNSNHSQSRNSFHSFRSSSAPLTNDDGDTNNFHNNSNNPATSLDQSGSIDLVPEQASPPFTVKGGDHSNHNHNENDEDGEAEEPEEENNHNNNNNSPKVYKSTGIHLSETTVISGEEEETCIYQGRAKLYRFKIHDQQSSGHSKEKDEESQQQQKKDDDDDQKVTIVAEKAEWCEIGTGPIKILSKRIGGGDSSSPPETNNRDDDHHHPILEKERIVMRREEKKHGTGFQLILNVALVIGTSLARHTDNTVRMIGRNFTSSNGLEAPVINTYLIRFKGKKECDDFFQIIEPRLKRLQATVNTPTHSNSNNSSHHNEKPVVSPEPA